MSYTVEWITPIYDRTYGDIQKVLNDPTLVNPKGCYNALDILRVENNTQYVMEDMLARRIIGSVPEGFITVHNWQSTSIVTKSEMQRIIGNIIILMRLSNPAISGDLEPLSTSAQITYRVANAMEKNLEIMKNQPELPIQNFYLELEHGIIQETQTSAEWISENSQVTIQGVPYGEYAQFMTFTGWSGSAEDLLCLANPLAQTTTLTMPFRDVSLTATFETHLPRTLTINSGHICESGQVGPTGPTQITCYAGDRILIVAGVAPSGKAFWNWTGTPEALGNLTGGDEPSSAWLVMPDMDVTLTANYVNAGQHKITIYQPSGNQITWHNYDEYVSIVPEDLGSKYSFDYWSGSTQYLTDIYDAISSFRMPDVNISFTPHYQYNYSYNTVQVINGKITVDGENVSSAENLRETDTYTLIPQPPYNNYGLYQWQVEGYGTVSGNTFRVGDGDAIITGVYRPIHTLTVENINNSGETTTYSMVEGKSRTLTTYNITGNYNFQGWYENGILLSSDYEYTITMGALDRTIEARYYSVPLYTVTLINRNNGGQTTTSTVRQGGYWSTTTNDEVGDYVLSQWLRNGTSVTTSTSYGFYVYTNTTIEIQYRLKETYHLTVNNGSGSGDYREREPITVTANEGNFSRWVVSNLFDISNLYSRTTTVKLGRHNGEMTANFNMRTITVITNGGTNTYQVRPNESINIDALPAPSDYEFDQWVIDSGDATISNSYSSSTRLFAHTQNSTVRATYKVIPYFTVTVENGYLQNENQEWVTSGTFLRGSSIPIRMMEAPEGYQFLQWEVLQGNEDAVYQPLAETTYVRNLLENVTVRATYYIPQPEVQYNLTITGKDGSVTTSQHAVGDQVTIYADYPDTGYEFRRWTGDIQYLSDQYSSTTIVNMPAKNISLGMQYQPEGAVEKFHVILLNGELLLSSEEDPETHEIVETWSDNGEFEEGSVVQIRAVNIPSGYSFYRWWNPDDNGKSMSTVTQLESAQTTLTVEDFDITLERAIVENGKYPLTLLGGGQRSGNYYADQEVPLYFPDLNTETIHYTWLRWSGTDITWAIANLRVKTQSGITAFDPYDDGDAGDDPQIIIMPARALELEATFTTEYRLNLINATSQGQSQIFISSGTQATVTANQPPTGKVFWKWSGDVDYILGNALYNSTITVEMPNAPINLTALYENASDPTNIGYISENLYSSTQVSTSDITVISGTIQSGFILTDVKGHLYMIDQVENGTATIIRLTQKQSGGDV